MASPFPGVDPFLESQNLWPEFHSKVVNCWHEVLLDCLPPQYDARMDERIYLADLADNEEKLVLPDVAVERRSGDWRPMAESQATATLEPVTVRLALQTEAYEPYIRILHRDDQELVAILEVLSPANKILPSRGDYWRKRLAVLNQPIHLVELDLLLGGPRLRTSDPLPPAHYYAMLSRANLRPQCQVYYWTVRDPLPTIPIPLKSPDPDLLIDLGAVFRLAYQRGRYERVLDYRRAEGLPLDEPDRAWVMHRAQAAAS